MNYETLGGKIIDHGLVMITSSASQYIVVDDAPLRAVICMSDGEDEYFNRRHRQYLPMDIQHST